MKLLVLAGVALIAALVVGYTLLTLAGMVVFGQIAWLRLKRDRVAMGGGILVLFLIVVAIFAALSFVGESPSR